ncbi:hypothetical protein CEXT_203871 [Caerostris extrusa]|uniref:Uncharacterized protein n=1 Tax=Caerostris extrusa TaxID=172846 RepID=A0AAV4Y485_CAEEX|nr:hypothetical protein CEXT_203871 [Caerostris extrusa]
MVLTTKNRFPSIQKAKISAQPTRGLTFLPLSDRRESFLFPNQFLFRIRVLILSSIPPLAPNPFEDNQYLLPRHFSLLEIPIWHASKFEGV